MSQLAAVTDVNTGEIVYKNLSPEFVAEQQNFEAEQAIINAEKEAKNAARQSLLNRLGLTEEEAKLLLG